MVAAKEWADGIGKAATLSGLHHMSSHQFFVPYETGGMPEEKSVPWVNGLLTRLPQGRPYAGFEKRWS